MKVNHPGCVRSVATRNFLDDAATPPCGDARRGLQALDFNSFTPAATVNRWYQFIRYRPPVGDKSGHGFGTHSKIHFASGEYHGQPSVVPPPRLSPINNLFVASERRGDGFGNSTGLTRENLRQGLHKKYRSLQIVEVWEMSCRQPAHVNNHSGRIVEGHRQSSGFR
jgi:hypothetical protein